MDQNSGDGESNSSEGHGSEQCDVMTALASSKTAPSSVFNVGAPPFVSTTDHKTAPPPTPGSAGDSIEQQRPYPWKGVAATSTPINEVSIAHAKPLMSHTGRNTRLGDSQLCSLMHSLSMAVKPGQADTKLDHHHQHQAPPPPESLPGNILRHLNNNNIMGNLLQETNPPPQGIGLGPRSASDYRAYFNGNFMAGGNNELHLINNGHANFMPRALAANNGANHLTPAALTGLLPSSNNNGGGGGGMFPFRLDLEENNKNNNCQRSAPTVGNGVPTTGPHPATIVGPGNQFHHVRGVVGCGLVPPPPSNVYGEERFFVGNQDGIIQLKLKDGIEIEMTLDGAIRVVNWRCNVSISLASSSNSAALIHPNGRVLQYHSRVEIMTYDGKNKNNFVRFAKIWYKGISFTSENNALVYLVDSGGTRTTTDSFMDLRNDITEQVFLTGSTHGPAYDNQARKEVANHKYWPALDGTEVHELNGFRIAQTVDGMVRITKANKNILVRTSPGNGSATLTTAYIHCTASLGQTSHLFVRRGERRMHFDGAEFVVRNSGHSAGFDSNNLLRVY